MHITVFSILSMQSGVLQQNNEQELKSLKLVMQGMSVYEI